MNLIYPKKAYIVNAFTKNKLGGNKAGVVIGCENLSSEDMLKIAKYVNLSETAFITKATNQEYDFETRFFTPETEVDLCGHATIAAFYTLAALNLIPLHSSKIILKQKTLAGILEIELNIKDKSNISVLMTQTKPQFYQYINDIKDLCSILHISEDEVGLDNLKLSPMVVSTGLKDIIFPIKSLNSLKKINPDFSLLKNYTDKLNVVGLHAFTFETENPNSTVATRNFAPSVGINEESATGTSNGALAAFILKHNLLPFKDSLTIKCEQGYYMNNPSEIICKCNKSNDINIKVGGNANIEKIINLY